MNFFLFMSPFFFFFGFLNFLLCFFFLTFNFSLFLQWNFVFSSFYMTFPLYFDYISCLFMGMVLLISGCIILYSEYYMMFEIFKIRFFFLMSLFVMSMIFLIICPNMFCMLLGWDGLGLISYLLVIFYQNYKSFNSGMITVLTNRIGDVFILSSISLFFSYGSWNYMNFGNLYMSWFYFMFFLASLTKSAQIPFSAWLPAAMAAPTPVSSLVHSSTLVTAGVYILIRFNYFLNENLKLFLLYISLCTMIMSGVSGLFEFDLKKIIALSTLSQLGFMMSTISIGLPDLAFFHLITHAGFKALLFMCAGFFIHNFFDNQDIRFFGLMNKNFCFSLCMFNVSNLSLSGFPFLSGFFSKDLILELMLMKNIGFFFFIFFSFGTFLTVLYSFRLFFYLTFKFSSFFFIDSYSKNLGIQSSMILLFFFSVFLGYLASMIFFFPYNYLVMPLKMKLFIFSICLMSFFFCMKILNFYLTFNNLLIGFFSSMWFLPFLKTDFLKSFFLFLSYKTSKCLVIFVENFFGLKLYTFFLFFSDFFLKFLKIPFFFFSFFYFFYFFIYLMFF